MNRLDRSDRPQGGTVSVMTIGFVMLIALLSVVVVNASAAYLERQGLMNAADGAALAAADGLDEEGFYTDRRVALDAEHARELVRRHVRDAGTRVLTVRVAGDEVTVRLARRLKFAVVPDGWQSGTTIVAEAKAQLRGPQDP